MGWARAWTWAMDWAWTRARIGWWWQVVDESRTIIRVTAVEVAVAATGSTFKGGRVNWGSSRARHELSTAIQGMSTQVCCMVFEALFVGNHHFLMMVVDDVAGAVLEE